MNRTSVKSRRTMCMVRRWCGKKKCEKAREERKGRRKTRASASCLRDALMPSSRASTLCLAFSHCHHAASLLPLPLCTLCLVLHLPLTSYLTLTSSAVPLFPSHLYCTARRVCLPYRAASTRAHSLPSGHAAARAACLARASPLPRNLSRCAFYAHRLLPPSLTIFSGHGRNGGVPFMTTRTRIERKAAR